MPNEVVRWIFIELLNTPHAYTISPYNLVRHNNINIPTHFSLNTRPWEIFEGLLRHGTFARLQKLFIGALIRNFPLDCNFARHFLVTLLQLACDSLSVMSFAGTLLANTQKPSYFSNIQAEAEVFHCLPFLPSRKSVANSRWCITSCSSAPID